MISKFKFLTILFISLNAITWAAPEIILERPNKENMTVYESRVIFKGKVNNALSLTINGLAIPLTLNGTFEYSMQLNSKNGNNYFLIEASDGTNKAQLNRTIFYSEQKKSKGKKTNYQ